MYITLTLDPSIENSNPYLLSDLLDYLPHGLSLRRSSRTILFLCKWSSIWLRKAFDGDR